MIDGLSLASNERAVSLLPSLLLLLLLRYASSFSCGWRWCAHGGDGDTLTVAEWQDEEEVLLPPGFSEREEYEGGVAWWARDLWNDGSGRKVGVKG